MTFDHDINAHPCKASDDLDGIRSYLQLFEHSENINNGLSRAKRMSSARLNAMQSRVQTWYARTVQH